MRLLAVTYQVGLPGYGITAELRWRSTFNRGMNSVVCLTPGVLQGRALVAPCR